MDSIPEKSETGFNENTGPHPLRLLSVSRMTPETYLMLFEILRAPEFHYHAGQWIALRHGADDEAFFSIASAPNAVGSGLFEVALRDYGERSSAWLLNLLPGTAVMAFGPYGSFSRVQTQRVPTAYIGTGTGVAPFRAMLQAQLSHQPSFEMPRVILAGHRDEERILWRDEFEAWDAQHVQLTYWVTLSNPASGWQGLCGYVQDHVRALAESHAFGAYFVCGHASMVQDVSKMLVRSHGVERSAIHTEPASG
ncbi:MAG: FAD-dependent oxidoreductase [Myxococcales bacterium]|nr:FAD-dependent oxidoreductase [Myxococcales bacterium]MCB9708747.1 FAD-dependent oxidoreductase [Myxococcales bacterium]